MFFNKIHLDFIVAGMLVGLMLIKYYTVSISRAMEKFLLTSERVG